MEEACRLRYIENSVSAGVENVHVHPEMFEQVVAKSASLCIVAPSLCSQGRIFCIDSVD